MLFKFTEFGAIFQSVLFCVSKMVSADPNHLTAEEVCQTFAIQAVSRIEYVTIVDVSFRRSLLLSGKLVGRAHV